MTLTHLSITNFQSLRNVELELGDFTVIVGASNTGKSALIRALKAVASNVRGSGVITRGQKSCAVSAHTDTHVVTLTRSDTSGSYRLAETGNAEQVFTKLNGGVPEQVTQALRIDPVPATGVSVNFASQFDRPYLLDESGANIARVLGELTNVNTVFEAVRAANKIRLNAASTLKTRRGDLVSLKTRLLEFQGLAERLDTLEVAERNAQRAAALQLKIDRLDKDLKILRVAEAALDKAQRLPVVPSPEPLNAALRRLRDFTGRIADLNAEVAQIDELDTRLTSLAAVEATAEHALADLLNATGACPYCGKPL